MTLLNHNKERKFTFYTVLQFSTPTDVINLCRKTWIRKSGHYGVQCKQTERFSVIEKRSDYFLSLDDKFKPRYNVKINKVQEHDPYQTKKEELSGDISKFHQCSDIAYYSWYFFFVCHWVHWLRKDSKRMKVWSPTISSHQDGSRPSFLFFCSYLLKWPWLLDGSVHVIYFLLNSTVHVRH